MVKEVEPDFFGGVLAGAVAMGFVILLMLLFADPYQRAAAFHCKALGHSDGQWDADAKRIRCFDVTRTEVEAK